MKKEGKGMPNATEEIATDTNTTEERGFSAVCIDSEGKAVAE